MLHPQSRLIQTFPKPLSAARRKRHPLWTIIREHWSLANALHGVVCRADAWRRRTGHAAFHMAVLRQVSHGMSRRPARTQLGSSHQQRLVGGNMAYMEKARACSDSVLALYESR